MTKLVAALDPHFDKYRAKPVSVSKEQADKAREKEEKKFQKQVDDAVKRELKDYTPKNEKELVQLLRRTPREVLSVKQRNLISGAMSFDKRKAILITMPKDDITFLKDTDFLGPINLDKLYKTGDTVFPVLNKNKRKESACYENNGAQRCVCARRLYSGAASRRFPQSKD